MKITVQELLKKRGAPQDLSSLLRQLLNDMIEEKFGHLRNFKDGYTPQRGKDYFTAQDVQAILQQATPKKGVHYFTDAEKRALLKEATPIKGVHYNDGAPSTVPGPAGKSLLPEEVVPLIQNELRNLSAKDIGALTKDDLEEMFGNRKISSKDVIGLKKELNDLRRDVMLNYGGHGGHSTGGGFTLLPATGTVNSVNTTFTFTQQPTYIISDGAWYTVNKGFTFAGLTATMTIPPNDNIFGFV